MAGLMANPTGIGDLRFTGGLMNQQPLAGAMPQATLGVAPAGANFSNFQVVPASPTMRQVQPIQPHPLVNTASGYNYPLTSGLMGSLTQPATPPAGSLGTAPNGGTNWSQIALQMAGNPMAGPRAAVPVPSGVGIPGASTGSSGSSSSGVLGGLMGALLQNPNLTTNVVNGVTHAISGLLGGSPGPAAGLPAMSAADTGGYGMLPGGLVDPSTFTAPTGDIAAASSTLPDITDYSDSGGFNGAGGQAATPSAMSPSDLTPASDLTGDMNAITPENVNITGGSSGGVPSSIGGLLGDASNAMDIYGGLKSGTPVGDASAAINAAGLANKLGAFGSASPAVTSGLGAAGGLLGLYTGLKQGGVVGDTQAALAATQLAGAAANAGLLGTGALSSAAAGAGAVAGDVALPLGVALYGASKPGVELSSTWYNNLGNTVGAGLGPNATVQQKLQAASQLDSLGLMQMNGTGGSSGLSTASNFDMGRLMQVLAPYGVTSVAQASQLANSLFNSIPAGQMPTGPGRGNPGGLIKPQ